MNEEELKNYRLLKKRKACNRQDRAARKSLRKRIFDKIGHQCSNSNCKWMNDDGTLGCRDERLLDIDHIQGDGNAHRKSLGGKRQNRSGDKYYRTILKDLEIQLKYQPLCTNCHRLKTINNIKQSI